MNLIVVEYEGTGVSHELSLVCTRPRAAHQTPNIAFAQGFLGDIEYAAGLIYTTTGSVYNPSTQSVQPAFDFPNRPRLLSQGQQVERHPPTTMPKLPKLGGLFGDRTRVFSRNYPEPASITVRIRLHQTQSIHQLHLLNRIAGCLQQSRTRHYNCQHRAREIATFGRFRG
jgi:hypothetical protein